MITIYSVNGSECLLNNHLKQKNKKLYSDIQEQDPYLQYM
jgi:hypothetical protein